MKLKNVLIVWLFSLLFVPCFSNSWYVRQIWVFWYSPFDNSLNFKVNSKWDLLTEDSFESKRVLFFRQWAFFYWSSSWLPYVHLPFANYQWIVSSYYLCDEVLSSSSSFPSNCVFVSTPDWLDNTAISILSSVSKSDYWYFDYKSKAVDNRWWNELDVCFSSSYYWKSVCYHLCDAYNSRTDVYCKWLSLTRNNVISQSIFDSSINFSSLDSSYLYSSPWYWTPAYLDSDYTNQDVMLSWSREWYTKDLCYSNFPITQLFDMSSSYTQIFDDYLEDWMWYWTGATIIDLYDEFNLIDFGSFYSQFIWNTRLMLRDWVIPSYFSWKSVWLWNIWYRLLQHNELWSNFNAIDYEQFCRFALNLPWNEWDWNYNWPELPSNIEDNLDTEKHIRICSMTWSETSAFCGAFSVWGWGWGWGGRLAGISDFYNKWFWILGNLSTVSWPSDWILPLYIIVGFLGFVLLYMLKR